MSFYSFDRSTGNGKSGFWNYTNKEKDNYSTELIGYVVELSNPCKTKFGTNIIERFKDGNPMRNIRVTILTDDGNEVNWDFNPGGKDNTANGGEDKRSSAMKAWTEGILRSGIENPTGLEDILGMKVKINTEEPPGNFEYSRNNPRPWTVRVDPNQTVEHRGTVYKKDWEKEGGEVDAPPIEPAQVGDGTKEPSAEFLAKQQAAAEAVAKMNQSYDMEINASSVYDEDIPF